MKELLIKALDRVGLAYWVEIVTDSPRCTYYFGPFGDKSEAEAAQRGYVEDLQYEGAQNIVVTIKRCKPDCLTVVEECEDNPIFGGISALGIDSPHG